MANHHQSMTIRDYLEACYQRPIRGTRAGQRAELRAGGGSFGDLLRDKNPQVARKPIRGLTAADYRAAALSVHRRAPESQEPPVAPPGLPAEMPLPGGCTAERNQSSFKPPVPETRAAVPFQARDQIGGRPRNLAAGDDQDRLIDRSIHKAARKYRLEPGLIRAVIRAESNFQVDARSPAGAQGLMQLMPATARELGVSDSYDIDQNIDGGARYLRQMLDRYSDNLKMALSAYNAGPGNVDKYGGRVPFAETRQYVDRVLRFARSAA